jgi:Predicted transcriptional regulators
MTKNSTNYTSVPKILPVSVLKVDTDYQRFLSMPHGKTLAKNFNPGLIGVLIVSQRADGYYVIDGQHRLFALRANGIQNVMCIVYTGLSKMQEAKLFVEFNGGRKTLTPSEKIKSKIEAGDPITLEIKDVVETCGLILGVGKKLAPNTIVSFTTLEHIHKQAGTGGLFRILYLTSQTWEGALESLDHRMLGGMKIFVVKAGHLFTDSDFISKLKKFKADEILREGMARVGRVTKPEMSCAETILMNYNYNRSTKRIPNGILY